MQGDDSNVIQKHQFFMDVLSICRGMIHPIAATRSQLEGAIHMQGDDSSTYNRLREQCGCYPYAWG